MADDVSIVFGAQIEGLVAGVEEAKAQIESLRAPVDSFVSGLGGIAEALGAAFVVDKIRDFAKEMAEVGEEMEHTAATIGMPVAEFAQLTAAMTAAVGSAEGARVTIQRLGVNMETALSEPTGRAAQAFTRLGISQEQIRQGMTDTTFMLKLLADKWLEYSDGLAKTAVYHDILGRNLASLIPLLRRGSEGFDEFQKKAEEVGGVLDTKTVAALAGTKEQMNLLAVSSTGLGAALVTTLKPEIDGIIQGLIGLFKALHDAISATSETQGALSPLAAAFRVVILAIKDTIAIIDVLIQALSLALESINQFARAAGAAASGIVSALGALASGDITGVGKAFQEGWSRNAGIMQATGDDMKRRAQRMVDDFKSIAGAAETSTELPEVTVHGGKAVPPPEAKEKKAKAGKEAKDDSDAIALERLSSEQKIDDIILDRRTKLIQASFDAHKVSLASEYDLLVQNADKKWASDQSYFEKKKALEGNDLKELVKLNDEEAVAYQQYLTKRQELDTQYYEKRKAAEEKAAADSKTAWDKVFAGIDSSFQSAITGFIQGTTTLQQALQRAFQSVLIDPLIKNVENGLKSAVSSAFSGTDIANTFIGKFFSGTLFGSLGTTAAAGQVEVLGTASTTAAAQVTAFGAAASAATAALGTSAAAGTASAAGGVASAASGGGFFSWLGGLFGFERGGIVPSAQGGWAVPAMAGGGVLAQLHSREMVLPASLSSFIQNAASRAGNSYSNASLNYAPVYNSGGGGAQMLPEQFFRQHGSRMMGEIRRAVASGWRP